MLIPLLAAIGVTTTLLSRGPKLLGTNHIPDRGSAVILDRGQTVCHPRQPLPDGTRLIGVGFEVSGKKRVPVVFTLRAPSVKARQVRALAPGSSQVQFAVPVLARYEVGEICVRSPAAPIGIKGIAGVYPNLAPRKSTYVRVDGKMEKAQIALTYSARGRPRLVDLVPEILHRETVFRPKLFGAWLYWLAIAAMPILWIFAIRTLFRDFRDADE